jgi:alcohol dehydrogenase
MKAFVYLGAPKKALEERPKPVTHRFKLDQVLEAYETFAHPADIHALKVILEA